MSETQKFTKEEIDQIQSLRETNAQRVNEFGQIELELLLARQRYDAVMEAKTKLTEDYKNLQEKEQNFVQELNKKYGAGTVDIANGEFTPAK
jgi:hypothetical protein